MGFVYLYLLERLHAFSHVQYMIVEHKDTDVRPPRVQPCENSVVERAHIRVERTVKCGHDIRVRVGHACYATRVRRLLPQRAQLTAYAIHLFLPFILRVLSTILHVSDKI